MGLFDFLTKSSSFSQKKTETPNIQTPFSQKKTLSIGEIEFLEYLSNHDTDITTFSKHFSYQYNLNYKNTVNLLLKNDYINVGSAKESLVVNKVQDLKAFLKSKELSVSGKKDDLIQRILEQTTDYDTYFPKRIFVLTEKGEDVIQKYKTAVINDLKKKVSDSMFYIRKEQFEPLVPMFKSEGNKNNPISLGYDKDSIINDATAINEYRKMGHDSDRELIICIASVLCHYNNSNGRLFEELGCHNVSKSEISIACNSIRSLRTIAEWKKSDIKKYEIFTCHDERVCKKCKKHEGKKYLVSKAVLGKNIPPFCEECRCVMISIFK